MSVPTFGVASTYTDVFGVVHEVPLSTRELLLERLEKPSLAAAAFAAPPMVATPGRFHPELFGLLTLESGEVVRAEGAVDSPGYHVLVNLAGERRLVISTPELLPQPERGWGLAVQLYAARSRESWGIGDFRDLAAICRRGAGEGVDAVLVSPIHAMHPAPVQSNSPYSPASRIWWNLLHVAPGDAPGAERVDLSDLAAAGRALNAERRINRDRVWELKRTALERIWEAVRDDQPLEFQEWIEARGTDLARFATWCVLAERHGPDWRAWPEHLRRPASAQVESFAVTHADRVAFFEFCQWVADRQLAVAAHSGVDLVLDLAVGFDASSADAWVYQDLICFEFEVGCPPDAHNHEGQRWGLPPFDPHALAAADFEPFRKMVEASLRHARALRIDHVMQMWRLFWVPLGTSARAGTYVHYPVDAMLAILRLEACRRDAWIVGEDMGTVPDGVRETMAAIGMLGYRVAIRTNPQESPEASMGASSTHDQPTVAGLLTGSDAAAMDAVGKSYDHVAAQQLRQTLAARAGIDLSAPLGEAEITAAVLAQYATLATSPARIVLATLDDLAGVEERPNMPGTVDEWPNWRIALPAPVEEVLTSPLALSLAEMMRVTR